MLWTLWDILVPLIIAFLLGLGLGYLLWRWRRRIVTPSDLLRFSEGGESIAAESSATELTETGAAPAQTSVSQDSNTALADINTELAQIRGQLDVERDSNRQLQKALDNSAADEHDVQLAQTLSDLQERNDEAQRRLQTYEQAGEQSKRRINDLETQLTQVKRSNEKLNSEVRAAGTELQRAKSVLNREGASATDLSDAAAASNAARVADIASDSQVTPDWGGELDQLKRVQTSGLEDDAIKDIGSDDYDANLALGGSVEIPPEGVEVPIPNSLAELDAQLDVSSEHCGGAATTEGNSSHGLRSPEIDVADASEIGSGRVKRGGRESSTESGDVSRFSTSGPDLTAGTASTEAAAAASLAVNGEAGVTDVTSRQQPDAAQVVGSASDLPQHDTSSSDTSLSAANSAGVGDSSARNRGAASKVDNNAVASLDRMEGIGDSESSAESGLIDAVSNDADAKDGVERELKESVNTGKLDDSVTKAATTSGYIPSGWQIPHEIPDKEGRDKLTDIKGVGPKLEGVLHTNGIYFFRQVALLDTAGIDELGEQMPEFRGRIQRDNWVGQAQTLHQDKYGSAP